MSKTIKITDFDNRGRGRGDELNIPFTYPGDTVQAELTNKKKQLGRLLKIITPSPLRQQCPCPLFGTCGGCAWHGLKYNEQLKFKEAKVRKLFSECLPIIASPKQYHYRNRMDYAFGPNYTLGLKNGRHAIVNVEKCWLVSKKHQQIINRLRDFVSSNKLKSYITEDPKEPRGLMRHVVVREGENIDNTILNIITSDKDKFPLEELWEKVQDLVQGVTWSMNLSPADRSYGEIQQCFGQDHYLESLAGLKFRVPVQAFFQTNTQGAEKLIEIIKNFVNITGKETLLDLYSGTGSIGLSVASQVKQVVGIEENEPAVELSLSNAKINNFNNYKALAGKAEKVIQSLEGQFEVIVLDPPRPGVHKKVLQKIGEIKPKQIIYVSCNPVTQAYDISTLKEFGYQVEKCQPLDMFPHTPHIENIISLRQTS